MVPLPRAMWKIKRVHLNFLRAFTEKLTAWRENSKSNLTRKPDIGFSNEILHGIHSSGSAFFLNRIVKRKLMKLLGEIKRLVLL